MKLRVAIFLALAAAALTSCQRTPQVCPPPTGTPVYLTSPAPTAIPLPLDTAPVPVQVGGRTIAVDQVVEGALCNGAWSGTVYVGCDVQVMPWEEHPTFLKDCELEIDPGTVVYVAYHNDAPYYAGCSCHTGILQD